MAEESSVQDQVQRTPALKRAAFDCPRCGAFAHQTWEQIQRRGPSGHMVQLDDSGSEYGRWWCSKCAHCSELTVWREQRIIFPSSASSVPLPHEGMPDKARELYLEAREVIGISRRAGTALARASLESALRELDPIHGSQNLAARIEHVLPRVSESLTQMLTVIRHAGNESLHVVDDTPDEVMLLVLDPEEEEIVEFVFESLNLLVEELVAKPARTAKIYGKVPAGVRAKIEAAKQEERND